jgi:uncharacterized protein (DUF342 family)
MEDGGKADSAAVPPVGAETIGNLAELGEGQVLLPAFIERREKGLFVDAEAAAASGDGFRQFVERVFGAGLRFSGLYYAGFLDLLYGLSDPPAAAPIQLAADIVPFPPARQALYRTVKIAPDKKTAEYVFEPVEIEIEEMALVFGPPGEDGSSEVVGHELRKRYEPTKLDFDEFVAAMWGKEVRYGIDASRVREVIQTRQNARMVFAEALPPRSGRNASIEERTDALHRDNAPKILPDGRMDLRQFKNRFPQIVAGARLLQKMPRMLGKPGRDVTGALLEPELPQDFDLAPLAGVGTAIEQGADGEFIVAARDGFLNIDSQTNQISVTEKIVSREGVSMKTTGDVALTGDEFEEHGEVQERRVVEGKHMTFFADVYGNVVSHGGRVVLKSTIAGAQVTSPGGSIVVEGRASRAVLDARGGEVHAEYAEGCTIVAGRVTVAQAINCDILGEQVEIGVSEGSAIAGKLVKIGQSTARRETETIVSLLVPDMTRHEHDVGELEEAHQQLAKLIAAQDEKLAQMLADPGFKQYLALATTIAKGGAKLSAQHEANWRNAQAKFATHVRDWQTTQHARAQAQKRLDELAAELAALADRKLHVGDGIGCVIEAVRGDTLVRRLSFQPDQAITGGAQAQELAAHMREFGVSGDRMFWGTEGEFAWSYATAEQQPENRPDGAADAAGGAEA